MTSLSNGNVTILGNGNVVVSMANATKSHYQYWNTMKEIRILGVPTVLASTNFTMAYKVKLTNILTDEEALAILTFGMAIILIGVMCICCCCVMCFWCLCCRGGKKRRGSRNDSSSDMDIEEH